MGRRRKILDHRDEGHEFSDNGNRSRVLTKNHLFPATLFSFGFRLQPKGNKAKQQ
ncbi:hypothetical protein Hanom_Chr17g01556261 [Helianthus anomalus]